MRKGTGGGRTGLAAAIAAAVVVAAVALVLAVSWGESAPPPTSGTPSGSGGQHAGVEAASASLERSSLVATPATEGGEVARADLVAWTLRVLAIDERGDPVANVSLTVSSGVPYAAMWSRSRSMEPVQSTAKTDASGRASLEVRGPFAGVL